MQCNILRQCFCFTCTVYICVYTCTDDGDEMLKVVLDLGRNDYHPDDVSVQFSTNKMLVRVQRDESLTGVRNSIHREISRDIDVPDTVYPPSMRAALAPDGKLWIGASLTTNSDHSRVTPFIVQMMPRHSLRCCRVSQLYAIANWPTHSYCKWLSQRFIYTGGFRF